MGSMVISIRMENSAFDRMPGKNDYEETGGYTLINTTSDFITDENLVYEDGGGYTFISEWSTGFVWELARVVMMADNSPKFVYINRSGEIVWQQKYSSYSFLYVLVDR